MIIHLNKMEYPQNAALKSAENDFLKFVTFFHQQKGVDLSLYRQTFVQRRLSLRMSITKTQDLNEYTFFIKKNPEEFSNLLDALGVNVTEFFRDQEVFAMIRQAVIPELLKKKAAGNTRTFRIWSAACASGEEAYSLAILMQEELSGKNDLSVRIWATDMDKEALAKAAKAEYNAGDLKKLDKKVLEKYFIPVYNNRYQLKDEIRQIVKFQQHNLTTDIPLNFMDMIFCRNMMIYLNRKQQEVLIGKFHEALNSVGYLVVGKIENVWNKDLFCPVAPKDKIYLKVS